jgi:hypothetical protein
VQCIGIRKGKNMSKPVTMTGVVGETIVIQENQRIEEILMCLEMSKMSEEEEI